MRLASEHTCCGIISQMRFWDIYGFCQGLRCQAVRSLVKGCLTIRAGVCIPSSVSQHDTSIGRDGGPAAAAAGLPSEQKGAMAPRSSAGIAWKSESSTPETSCHTATAEDRHIRCTFPELMTALDTSWGMQRRMFTRSDHSGTHSPRIEHEQH